MTYAPAHRAFYDADSHIMELPDFLQKYADPALRPEIPAVSYSASIVTDAGGARLVMSSNTTGATSAVRITASDDDANNTDAAGLSALAFDPATSAGQMTQNVAAQNAAATVNVKATVSAIASPKSSGDQFTYS